MKYVMMRVPGQVDRLIPIIFPNILVHEDVSRAVGNLSGMETAYPVSAGDITFSPVHILRTSGRSETLKLSAAENDAEVIVSHDYLHGIVFETDEEEET